MTEEERGIVGLGHRLIGTLPAGMLAVLLVNLLVVGALFWHQHARIFRIGEVNL